MAWHRITPLATDEEHARQTHARWVETRVSAGYREGRESEEQCGGCAFYVPLELRLGMDWGACTNAKSWADGTLMFEHDGCDRFTPDSGPVRPEHIQWLEVERDALADEIKELREEIAGDRMEKPGE